MQGRVTGLRRVLSVHRAETCQGAGWRLEVYPSGRHPLTGVRGVPASQVGLDVDGVCLFSGGLDSLCGVIDLLEDDPDPRLCLLSHHEGGQASTAQQDLLYRLVGHYGPDGSSPAGCTCAPLPPAAGRPAPAPS